MRMMMNAAVAACMTLTATSAVAATKVVDFNFLSGATSLAQGEFTYDSSKSGVIGWEDLNSFSITALGVGYDLAFVNSGGFSDFRYLGWDTSGLAFVSTTIDGFPEIMSAIKSTFTSGFFIRQDPAFHIVTEYSTGNFDQPYDTLSLSVKTRGGVPEPATWALMIAGFGGVGAALRRRRVAVAA